METMNNILVYGCFKTGTHSLFNSLQKSLKKDDFLIERKHIDIDIFNKKHYKYIFYLVRDQEQIYKSAFFQDIIHKEYDYSLFNKKNMLSHEYANTLDKKEKIIQDLDINIIQNFYNNFDWYNQYHLNVQTSLDELCNYFKLSEINVKTLEKYQIQNLNCGSQLIVLNIEAMNNDTTMSQMFNKINLPIEKLNIMKCNESKNKWYSQLYDEFNNLEYKNKNKTVLSA
jgi:hypothetical protein